MHGRRRRAERRHGVADLVLRQREHVHVALDHQQMAARANRIAGMQQAVQLAPLLEQRRLGRIQILRLAFADHAATEADRHAAGIEDGKHHPIAEAVVALALVLDHQARFDQRRLLVLRKGALQRLPIVRRIADAKARRDLAGQPPALEIGNSARRFLQLAAIKLHRFVHERIEIGLALLARGLLRRRRPLIGHRHTD